MSEPFRGWGSILGLKAEATAWATTNATSDHWLGLISHTLQPEREVVPVPYLGATNAQISSVARGSEVIRHDYGGDIETLLEYDNPALMLLLEHTFGLLATTGAPSDYTHTFTLSDAKHYDGTILGLTGQVIAGQHSTLSKAEVVSGLVVNTMEISGDARGLVRVKFGLIGKSGGTFAAITGTPAVVNGERAKGHHAAALAWNSGTYGLNRWMVKLDRKLERRASMGTGLYTDKPAPSGPAEVTLEGELDWTTHALDTAIDAGTASDAVITLTGGTSPNSCAITVDNAQFTSLSRPLTGAGRRTQSFSMRGHYADASNGGLKMVFHNDDSSAHA